MANRLLTLLAWAVLLPASLAYRALRSLGGGSESWRLIVVVYGLLVAYVALRVAWVVTDTAWEHGWRY